MNARGRQFALGGKLDGWVRRERFDADETRVLRRCYAGREPRTFSRYGIRQWAAPLPSTRIVIKDPFAMLSLAAIQRTTGAIPVVVFRHPAAVLASYRRMGWTADTDELIALGAPIPRGASDVDAMASMWSWCHRVALDDLAAVPGSVVVSHHWLADKGSSARDALQHRLGLISPGTTRTNSTEAEPGSTGSVEPMSGSDDVIVETPAETQRRDRVLHDFERSSADVNEDWRRVLHPDEISSMELATAPIWRELESLQLDVPNTNYMWGDNTT